MKPSTCFAFLLALVSGPHLLAQNSYHETEYDTVGWQTYESEQYSDAEYEAAQWHDQIQQAGWQQDVPSLNDWNHQTEPVEDFQYTSGLLGRRILRFDVHAWEDDVSGVDFDGVQGDTQLSVPAPWTDFFFGSIFHDLFLNVGGGEESGSFRVPGTSFTDRPMFEFSDFEIGTTLFVSTLHGTRPFVQLGYRYEDYEFKVERKDSRDNSQITALIEEWSRDMFLANVGLEYDLHQRVGFRGQLDFETKEGISYSLWKTQLFVWPREYWFFNAGLWGLLNGDTVGFNLGAGVRF